MDESTQEWRDKLKAIKQVFVHSCADGLASAMIVREALRQEVDVTFLSYGSDEHKNLQPGPGQLFCDITPVRERAQEFVDAGAIVLDHHGSAWDIFELFGDNGVYANEHKEPGVSAAGLAYRCVWLPMRATDQNYQREPAEHVAYMVGTRDTWRKSHWSWEEASAMVATLMAFPREWWLSGDPTERLCEVRNSHWIGERRLAEQRERAKDVAQHLSTFEAGGLRWGSFPMASSKVVIDEVAEAASFHDVIVGFRFKQAHPKPLVQFSVRAPRGTFDAAGFARYHGGGGHRAAAGFIAETEKPLDWIADVAPHATKWHRIPVVPEEDPERDRLRERATRLGDERAGRPAIPWIVCLCGSTRFYKEFQQVNYEETMKGNIVLSVGFYHHSKDEAHGQDVGCTDEQKAVLNELHMRKIDLADEIVVVNVNGYIGHDTAAEIAYAQRTDKPVTYCYPEGEFFNVDEGGTESDPDDTRFADIGAPVVVYRPSTGMKGSEERKLWLGPDLGFIQSRRGEKAEIFILGRERPVTALYHTAATSDVDSAYIWGKTCDVLQLEAKLKGNDQET
jgi:oligoribonuclease NrnB/cAMP/cGMP phosphodiesterase (DHH superfamily)